MRSACNYAVHMGMIQIRNVPDDLHRQIKARAASAGVSLSDLVLSQIRAMVQKPTVEEVRARLASLPPVPGVDVVAALRAERDSR